MKNVLSYYYNLIPTSIHQINKEYKCYVDEQEYLLTEYNKPLDKLDDIYKLNYYLLSMQIPCHQIILNINNSIITYINNVPYILMKIYVSNKNIYLKDILIFQTININSTEFKSLVCDNWYNLWTKKIDYLEYQMSQIGKKFPIIRESFNYFIGLAENSISLLFELKEYKDNLVINHQRINIDGTIKNIYDPLNLIIDSKTRDIAEYIKNKFFFQKYNVYEALNDINKLNFTNEQYIIFFSRLLFPSYYFDIYEDIILTKKDENMINKILSKTQEYTIFLKDIWLEINKIYQLPEIEWIIKKM